MKDLQQGRKGMSGVGGSALRNNGPVGFEMKFFPSVSSIESIFYRYLLSSLTLLGAETNTTKVSNF